MTAWKFNFVLCSPNDCSSTKTRHLNAQKKCKSIELFQGHAYSNILQLSCALGKIEIVPRFQGFSVYKISLRISYLQLQYRKLQSEVSPSRCFALEPHAKEPYYQHGKQNYKETLTSDWSKTENNTSCNARGNFKTLCLFLVTKWKQWVNRTLGVR